MIDLAHPRDLVMIGAIFGLAAFIWSGWAQEAPPRALVWRLVLAGLGVAGLTLAVPSILTAIGNWSEPSAFTTGTVAFTLYLIVFWAEVIIAAVVSFFLIRAGQTENIAPLILAIVGIHFFVLAVVFGQPVLHLAGLMLTIVAVGAFILPRERPRRRASGAASSALRYSSASVCGVCSPVAARLPSDESRTPLTIPGEVLYRE